MALLIDADCSFETIFNLAKKTEKTLLKDVNLFDVYTGNNIPEGKKSYAVGFTILDTTKTLAENDIEAIMKKLQTVFEKELGAVLR